MEEFIRQADPYQTLSKHGTDEAMDATTKREHDTHDIKE